MLFAVSIVVAVVLTLVTQDLMPANPWDQYRTEATKAWENLRQDSNVLSFRCSEQWSVNGGPMEESEQSSAAVSGEQVFFSRSTGKRESAAVVAADCGFILRRKNKSEKWGITYYGPNRKQVRDSAGEKFDRLICPPLTPASGISFEELLSIQGVSVAAADEVVTDEGR